MKKILLLVSILLFANPAFSGIATLDATTTFYDDSGSITTFTGNYTVSSGTNTILIVQILALRWNGSPAGLAILGGLEWNGTPLTKVSEATRNEGDGAYSEASIWYLINPTAGGPSALHGHCALNANIVVWAASTYSGAKQSSQPDAASNEADTSGNDPSPLETSITTVDAGSWIFDSLLSYGITGSAVSGGQTENAAGFGSYKAATGAGAYTMGWTYSGAGAFSHALASFSPATASETNTTNFFQAL